MSGHQNIVKAADVATYLSNFMGRGAGIVRRFYNGEEQSVVDAGAWMQEAIQLMQMLQARQRDNAQPAEVALLQRALSALEYHRAQTRPIAPNDAVIEELRAALAAKGLTTDERTPTDYALEHAEYLAQAAEDFIDQCNELAKAEMERDELCGDEGGAATQAANDKVWRAKEALSEGMGRLRNCIHGFRTRRYRAAVALPHDPAGSTVDRAQPGTATTGVPDAGA